LVTPRPDDIISPKVPHRFLLCTPAEKYKVLASTNSGAGTLAVVHWVVGSSDRGEPTFSKPVVLVMAPVQVGTNVRYDLLEPGLSYHHPILLLGKVWSSKRMYPLLSPLFRDTRLCDADSLLKLWTTDWDSIYQFDHGL